MLSDLSDLSATISFVPISAEKVRELAARGERTTLDFKRQDYNWTANTANAELAKDLMAMANVLGPSAAPAYILIGVQNDKTIVGVPPTRHLDDAALHQKVRDLLNHTPNFLYAPVEVDGLSVGVYEISPGGRPYFSVKDASPLRKAIAVYRDGTSTEPASPSIILDWHREDDAVAHELRALELRKREAEAAVHGELSIVTMGTGDNGTEIVLRIENTGRSGYFIDSIHWRAEWSVGLGTQAFPPDYAPAGGPLKVPREGLIPPGGAVQLQFTWSRDDAVAHFRDNQLSVDGFNGRWFAYHFEIQCHTDLGGAGTLRYVAR